MESCHGDTGERFEAFDETREARDMMAEEKGRLVLTDVRLD
jgi:hypothetical protein